MHPTAGGTRGGASVTSGCVVLDGEEYEPHWVARSYPVPGLGDLLAGVLTRKRPSMGATVWDWIRSRRWWPRVRVAHRSPIRF